MTRGFYRFNNLGFLPDGQRLIVTGDIDSTQHPDRLLESEILPSIMANTVAQPWPRRRWRLSYGAELSHDGKWLALQFSKTSYVRCADLALFPIDGTGERPVPVSLDRNVGGLYRSHDDQVITPRSKQWRAAALPVDVNPARYLRSRASTPGVLSLIWRAINCLLFKQRSTILRFCTR